jgi:hypothetical protein
VVEIFVSKLSISIWYCSSSFRVIDKRVGLGGGGSSQRVRDSNFKMSIRVHVEKEHWLKIRKFIKDWQSTATYLVGGLMMVHQSRRE